MKPQTVFQAYVKARNAMETAAYFRDRQRGIAVERDRWAREWQRSRRQADLFEAWLTHFLEGLE